MGKYVPNIMRMVVGQSMWLVGGGVVAGALLAIPATRALRSLLFGVVPGDPLTLAVVGGLILVAGALASSVPAWRGTAVDPVAALRQE